MASRRSAAGELERFQPKAQQNVRANQWRDGKKT
jgi:hypothetical protein